ncbi:hypothetical protein A8H31_08965 [Burkholderia thailandensis]|nr:hypothetical protein A8H31_08965 [Burkholderia thailandensis]NOK43268.1 hypothetical protein [Burkholderia thailandensis]NOK55169.1 hypothetical protein [Burkholderia thailandensis]PNE70786.1 hypothetical protein A8H38_00175 [Burkholderia thailandensis]PNE84904.1 hypothetical protein A8H34_13060 [Burkholderia thailandensis]
MGSDRVRRGAGRRDGGNRRQRDRDRHAAPSITIDRRRPSRPARGRRDLERGVRSLRGQRTEPARGAAARRGR